MMSEDFFRDFFNLKPKTEKITAIQDRLNRMREARPALLQVAAQLHLQRGMTLDAACAQARQFWYILEEMDSLEAERRANDRQT